MRQEKQNDRPHTQVNLEETLNLLVQINKPLIDHLIVIREKGQAFISEQFGDYLIQTGIVRRIGKTEKCELTQEAMTWFDLNPHLDPIVTNLKKVTLPAITLNSNPSPEVTKEEDPLRDKKSLIPVPSRCVLMDLENNPTKFGIVTNIEETTVDVVLPGENNRTVKILLNKFDEKLEGHEHYWKILSDSDLEYSEQPEFDRYFKREPKPELPEGEYQDILNYKFMPLLEMCRESGDYRPLERRALAANSDIVPLSKYICGRVTPSYLFYRDPRIPLTVGEQSILTARNYSATKCEKLLEELNKKVELCRKLKDFSPLKPSHYRGDLDMLALAKYLSRHTKDGIISVYENKRVGLTKDELAEVQGELQPSEAVRIKKEKWDPLLAKCREQDDFSPLLTGKLNDDPDLASLLHYYGFPRVKSAKQILQQDLGVTKNEAEKIANFKYTFEFRQKLIREKILPLVLKCIDDNDFKPLEFRTFTTDLDLYGISIMLLNKRPSVAGLLSHPEVGFSTEEAKLLVEGNRSNKIREERTNSLPVLREKVENLILIHKEATAEENVSDS